MADHINHLTNVDGVLWYIDKVVINNDVCTISGWVSHPIQPIKAFLTLNIEFLTSVKAFVALSITLSFMFSC